jgi:hypothetical protein
MENARCLVQVDADEPSNNATLLWLIRPCGVSSPDGPADRHRFVVIPPHMSYRDF